MIKALYLLEFGEEVCLLLSRRDDVRVDVFVKFDEVFRFALLDNEEPHLGRISEEEDCKEEVFPCIWV